MNRCESVSRLDRLLHHVETVVIEGKRTSPASIPLAPDRRRRGEFKPTVPDEFEAATHTPFTSDGRNGPKRPLWSEVETFAVVQFRTTGKQSEAFSQMAMSERRLNEADRNGFFAGMAQGYTDYPTLSEAQGY